MPELAKTKNENVLPGSASVHKPRTTALPPVFQSEVGLTPLLHVEIYSPEKEVYHRGKRPRFAEINFRTLSWHNLGDHESHATHPTDCLNNNSSSGNAWAGSGTRRHVKDLIAGAGSTRSGASAG